MAIKKATTPAKKAATPKAVATKATKPAVKKIIAPKAAAPKAAAPKAAAPKTAAKKVVSKVKDIEEAIRRKATEIYNARIAKGEHGTPESDWLKAEKEVKASKKK